MKKLFVWLALFAAIFSGQAEDSPEIFPGVTGYEEIVSEEFFGGMRVVTLRLDTGEEIRLDISGETGNALSLYTSKPAHMENAGPQDRGAAEAVVLIQYPDALVITGRNGPNGEKRLFFIAPELAGYAVVWGDVVLNRSLTFGEFIADGLITYAGAEQILRMTYPAAEVLELEMDEDDGVVIYEGEALSDGAEYEFEISAVTGKLLEWERD